MPCAALAHINQVQVYRTGSLLSYSLARMGNASQRIS